MSEDATPTPKEMSASEIKVIADQIYELADRLMDGRRLMFSMVMISPTASVAMTTANHPVLADLLAQASDVMFHNISIAEKGNTTTPLVN